MHGPVAIERGLQLVLYQLMNLLVLEVFQFKLKITKFSLDGNQVETEAISITITKSNLI